MADVND